MKYVCSVCGYVYDEESEALPFASLPDSWPCPVCMAPKSAFLPQGGEEKKPEKVAPVKKPTEHNDLNEVKAGELSVLFSNLARGCEKQYHEHEAQLFKELASYFEGITPSTTDANLKNLADLIIDDLNNNYPVVEKEATDAKDRGTLRAYTWGKKVTTMQKAILERYNREGEEFLAHTNIWVCSVCGFIYVGDNPPEICPVCKVPAWKFEKVEGGAL